LVDHDIVAERHQIVGDGKRRRARADADDTLSILLARRLGQIRSHVVAEIGGNALQPADGHGLAVHATTAAGWLARPIARPAQNAREDVRFAVEEIRLRVPALGDQPDVLRYVGVGRTCPLAVDYSMVVLGVA